MAACMQTEHRVDCRKPGDEQQYRLVGIIDVRSPGFPRQAEIALRAERRIGQSRPCGGSGIAEREHHDVASNRLTVFADDADAVGIVHRSGAASRAALATACRYAPYTERGTKAPAS